MEQMIYGLVSTVVSEALDAAGFTRFNEGAPPPNLATQQGPFAIVNIPVDKITTMALGPSAPLRYEGAVEIGLFVKEGAGQAAIRTAKQELTKRLINVYIGDVLMGHQALAMGTRKLAQWQGVGFQYLFSADQLVVP